MTGATVRKKCVAHPQADTHCEWCCGHSQHPDFGQSTKTNSAKFEGGATRSHHAPECEHLSAAGILRIISRMEYGATIHGPHNWRSGGQEFVNQCVRHLFEHTINYVTGDTSDDHLAAIGANFQMLAEFEAQGLKPSIFPSKGPNDGNKA